MTPKQQLEKAFEQFDYIRLFDLPLNHETIRVAFIAGAKAGLEIAEQVTLAELGHINNHYQRTYSWELIQELVEKLRSLAEELK